MKILWINHRDPDHPQAGGAEVHIAEVGRRLAEQGHQITLLCERFRGSERVSERFGMEIRRFGGRLLLHLYAPYYVFRNSYRYDIIIDDVAHAMPFFSNRFTKKPVVAIVHHVHQDVLGMELSPIIGMIVKVGERGLRGYRSIISVSETTRQDLIGKLNVEEGRIKVIHLGVDHELYRPGRKSGWPTVIWVGRMKRYKHVDQIIEAFRLVRDSVPDAELILVGDGEEKAELLSMTNGIKGITFMGRVSQEEKVRLLQRAWCLVSASEVEGWGMTIIEAAACGTIAIAFDAGALSEAIIDGRTGIIVKHRDAGSLAGALIKCLTDQDMRSTLSNEARARSMEFDWNRASSETLALLSELKNGRHGQTQSTWATLHFDS